MPALTTLRDVFEPSDSHSRQGARGSSLRRALRVVLLVVLVVLPAVLILSAIESYRAVDEMREVYLRSRAATIALQLELRPADSDRVAVTVASEVDVAGIQLFSEPLPDSHRDARYVNPILEGKALYYSKEQRPVYRSYLPVHSGTGARSLQVARIETYSAAADFLVRDAIKHLSVTVVAAMAALATLGAYLLLLRRSARLTQLAQLGTMSAALAHEIRNPLGTIKGFVQLAREELAPPGSSYLQSALGEVGRLEKLVRELLLFARPKKPSLRPVNWKEIEHRLRAPRPNGQPQLVFDSSEDVTMLADADGLVEILSNLIRNGTEAAPEGHVRVGARRDGRSVRISVEDEGPGISDEVRSKIFEPFFSTKSSGTGLGLPISRALARQLNARLELLPRAPRGTIARLTLPVAQPQ